MGFLQVLRLIIWKDLTIEMRSREAFSAMFVFALIVILIFSFSFPMDQRTARDLLPGLLWVALVFASLLGLGRSFALESQNNCLEQLQMSPAPPGAIFLGKLAANAIVMLAVEAAVFPLFVIFFNLDVFRALPIILLIMAAGTLGLAALGTLLSALTAQVRAREVMLPILMLPLAVPVLIGAVEATRGALYMDPLALYRHWIEWLLICSVIFTLVSLWVFDFIMES